MATGAGCPHIHEPRVHGTTRESARRRDGTEWSPAWRVAQPVIARSSRAASSASSQTLGGRAGRRGSGAAMRALHPRPRARCCRLTRGSTARVAPGAGRLARPSAPGTHPAGHHPGAHPAVHQLVVVHRAALGVDVSHRASISSGICVCVAPLPPISPSCIVPASGAGRRTHGVAVVRIFTPSSRALHAVTSSRLSDRGVHREEGDRDDVGRRLRRLRLARDGDLVRARRRRACGSSARMRGGPAAGRAHGGFSMSPSRGGELSVEEYQQRRRTLG